MNKPVYNRNMQMLEKKYPVWADILRREKGETSEVQISIEKSYTDETIIKVQNKSKSLYLNGKYAPSCAAIDWLEEQEQIEDFATIIIIGISNGTHIKTIMEHVPDSVNILIYEPSFQIFQKAMEEVDLSFLFELNIPVGIIVEGINEFEIENYFHLMITYDNMLSLKIYMSLNYQQLFSEEVGEFIKKLKAYMQNIEVHWNTTVRYTDVNAQNIFHNLQYLYEGYSVADLKEILPDGVPVIIVSAGPSLNKNILELKRAVGKSCIIATDTAMKPLLNAGIIPDLFVIVDGMKPVELFEHKDISKVGMVTMTAVSTGPMDIHKGKKYFYDSGSPYETELIRLIDAMDERSVMLPGLPTGGSVATSAFSLGVYMGAKTIILVGQDLALTGNKVHVDGAFDGEECTIDMKSGEYLEVEAIDGGKVVTRIDFKLYLDWFEKVIKEWNCIQVIDATEGGALIHGSTIMKLDTAISKYCNKNYKLKDDIDLLPKIFRNEKEKKIALKYFKHSIRDLENVKKKTKEGLEYYKQLNIVLNNHKLDEKIFDNLYQKIRNVNLFIEKDTMAEMVVDSIKGVESAIRPLIYKKESDGIEEIIEIIKQGELMLMAIGCATDEIEEIIKKDFFPFVERCIEEEKIKV